MKFEVGKKYVAKTTGYRYICTGFTPRDFPIIETTMRNKTEIIVYNLNSFSEYVEPPLAVGDKVQYKESTLGHKYTILAIDGTILWLKNINNSGYDIQHISCFERIK